MTKAKILAFAGSSREGSINGKLVKYAAKRAEEMGAEVTVIDLQSDFPMPLFDQDEEGAHGVHENGIKLKMLMKEHDAFLIASPEYNSSITPLLKNSIDWASRAHEKGEGPLTAYKGKVAGLLSTAPGALGGLRGLVHVRSILGNIGVHVVPAQVAIGGGFQAFDDAGNLKDDGQIAMVDNVVSELVKTTTALK